MAAFADADTQPQRNDEFLELARRFAASKADRRTATRALCSVSSLNKGHSGPPGCTASCASCNCIKAAVSLKKRRFIRSGFDLDLTYITDRVIAMGFPSSGCESCYRNSASSTHDFLTQRHGGHFRIWNLCSESGREYPKSMFPGDVIRIGFPDHNAPKMSQIETFCRGVDEWLAAHVDNVAAVHCKAGKGRTGTMIAAYLLWCGAADTAAQAADHFGVRRTHNKKGVVIPSQLRFVRYTELWLRAKARAGALIVREAEADALAAVQDIVDDDDAVAEAADADQVADEAAAKASALLLGDAGEGTDADADADAGGDGEQSDASAEEEDEEDEEDDEDDAAAGAVLPAVDDEDIPATVSAAGQTRAAAAEAAEAAKGVSDGIPIGPWTQSVDPSLLPARPVTITSVALSALPTGLKHPLFVAVYSADNGLLATTARAAPGDGTFRETSTGNSLPFGLGGLPLGPASAAAPGEMGASERALTGTSPPRRMRAVSAAASSVGSVYKGSIPSAVALLKEGYRATGYVTDPPTAARAASGVTYAPSGQRVTFASSDAGDATYDDDYTAAAAAADGTPAGKGGDIELTLPASPSGVAPGSRGGDEPLSPSSLRLPVASLLSPGDGYQSVGYGPLAYALPRGALSRHPVAGTVRIVLLSGPDERASKPVAWFWVHTAFLPFPEGDGGAIGGRVEDIDRTASLGGALVGGEDGLAAVGAATADALAAAGAEGSLLAETGAGDAKDAGDGPAGTGVEAEDEADGAGGAVADVSGPELATPSSGAVAASEDVVKPLRAGPVRVGWMHVPKTRLDKVFKDKKHDKVPAHFSITLFYEGTVPVGPGEGVRALDLRAGAAAVAARLSDEALSPASV